MLSNLDIKLDEKNRAVQGIFFDFKLDKHVVLLGFNYITGDWPN